jgi:putative GTP pyrophosphokinase
MSKLIDKEEFFKKYNKTQEDLDKTGLQWENLEEIYQDYLKERPNLENTAVYLFNSLMKIPRVHSVRYRVKDAEHVIEKIIRKRIEKPDRVITLENYKSQLTDLIGLRALHLFKEEWMQIHRVIVNTLNLSGKPTA